MEQLFGNIKNMYGDRDRTRKYKSASLHALGRFCLWNIIDDSGDNALVFFEICWVIILYQWFFLIFKTASLPPLEFV